MADVIELKPPRKDRPKFIILRHETARHLGDAANELPDDAVNLAFAGPWAEWGDDQKVGAVASITTEALIDCGDERVAALARLHDQIQCVIAALRAKPK
jgi:hypothetical protein